MLAKLVETMRYNKDWPRYLYRKYFPGQPDDLLSFRMRGGATLTLKSESRYILNEIFVDRSYDVPGVRLADCRTILDIGANVGMFALHAWMQAPTARIVCLEPSSQNHALLMRNVEASRAAVDVHRRALAAQPGERWLTLDSSPQEYALTGESVVPTGTAERVPCIDLASALDLTGAATVDFVKIDIEGAEREIFAAAADDVLLRMNALALEWHYDRPELEQLAARFTRLGFAAEAAYRDRVHYLKARRTSAASVMAH